MKRVDDITVNQANGAASMTDDVMRQPKDTGFGQVASMRVANCSHQRSLLVYICLFFLYMLPCSANAQTQLDGDDIQAFTARTVLGIVSYAKWPVQPEFYRFCMVGNTVNLRTLSERSNEVAGRELRMSMPVTDGEQWLSECDILYLGAMAGSQRLAILKKTNQEAILTIGEGDEMCSDGMMFCLGSIGQKAVFLANLDAIARSRIRINANVLLLLRHRSPQP